MKRYLDKRNNFGTIWSATTAHFTISLVLVRSHEKYDGDDEGGETQAELDSGELVMFDSKVIVEMDFEGESVEIGSDYLSGSVYKSGETHTFVDMGGYFGDMLNIACAEARCYLDKMPKLRSTGYLLKSA